MLYSTIRPWLACAILAGPLNARPEVIVTLTSVGDLVRSQNPELAAARLRIREAVGRMSQAGRPANPELETAFEHNPDSREGRFEIGISRKFPLTDRLALEKQVSLTELKSAEAEVREVERRIITSAREVVVQLLAARQCRELLREQSRLAAKSARLLSEAAAKGEVPAIDAAQAKLEAAGLTMEIRQLDAAEAALTGELKPLLGMRPGDSPGVSGVLSEQPLPATGADPSRRPDFQVATLDARAAAQGVALEQSRRYDDVEGGLFAAAERTEDAPEGYDNEAVIGLRIKVPLPFWNKNEGAVQEAVAKRDRKELEARALAHGIRLEAETARAEMARWGEVIREINDSLMPLAEEQAKLTEAAYHAGQGELQSMLRSQEKRLRLAVARIDALREFHLARIRHDAAINQQ